MRPTVNKNCLNCDKIFAAQVRYVKKGEAKFCSTQCVGKHKSKNTSPKKSNVKCALCNKSFYKKPSRMKSKSGLSFCCRKHKDLAQRVDGLDEMTPAHYGTATPTLLSKSIETMKFNSKYRRIAFTNLPRKCDKCDYNAHIQLLEVHHIDRNRDNNDLSNLKILCVMCHRKHHLGL